MRLTDKSLAQLKFLAEGQKRIRDDLLPGFGVTVGKRTKTFFVMYSKERKIRTLGQYPEVSLKTARDEARKLLSVPTSKTATNDLQEAISDYLKDAKERLRPKTLERYKGILENLKGKRFEDVDLTVTDPTTLKVLKAFFNWCIDQQLTDRNPFIRRRVVFNQRDRLLTDEEIKAIWHYEHKPYSDIVKALLLSGQRRNQIWRFQEEWCSDNVITFPASIMKTKRTHVIPKGKYFDYIHPSTFNSWSKAKTRMDKHTEVTGYVLHDLRRYFSTTMAMLGVPLLITEQLIDHRSQLSGVAAIYNKFKYIDEMTAALDLYEKHIDNIVA